MHISEFLKLPIEEQKNVQEIAFECFPISQLQPEEFKQFCEAVKNGSIQELGFWTGGDSSGFDELSDDQFNNFTEALVACHNLKILSFSSAGLHNLPHNRLKQLCDAIAKCTNLQEFYFGGNNFNDNDDVGCHKALGRAFQRCRILQCSGYGLKDLTDECFEAFCQALEQGNLEKLVMDDVALIMSKEDPS